MSIDNDTNTDRVPSSGIPSADSPPSVNVPPAPPKPKSASAERQQRFRERKKGREAGFAVPKRASSGPRVHRTTATRPDFSAFNAGASYAKPASSTDPAAAFRAGALPAVATPTPEESKVTEEEAAMYARGLVFYTKMGVVALMQKQKLTPEQMQEALTEYLPFVEALVGGCTVGVVKRWNIRVPFIEEGVVAAAIGISTFALTWGHGDHMLSNALAIGKGLASGKVPVVAVGAGEQRETRNEAKQETPSESAAAGDDADGAPVDLEKFK